MNCEPCKSLEVTCNHNVTIGYLKDLVSEIPSTCCTTLTVSGGYDNTYCPTYGQLTNGSILPLFSDGGSGSWSNNKDGITISSSYSSNQLVAKKDLKLIYTAFESLTISNSSRTVSECGGSSTTSKSLIFRKYTRECNKTATSTTQADSTLSVRWYGTDSSSSGVKSYSRNTNFSTRSSTVYCTISWRGCSHTSNSITVSQRSRAFDHYNDYSRSSGESVSVTCYPYAFDCNSGTSTATAIYYYTTWTERHYIDTCGYEYDEENVNFVYNNTLDISEHLNATSHTYEACAVATRSDSEFTFSVTYDNLSDSDYCYQECGGCETCPPPNHIDWTSVTASCRSYSRSITVTGISYTYSGGEYDEEGKCTGYTETTASTSYTKTVTCGASGWIDNNIYITGGPCCSTNTAYTYDDVVIPCSAANSTTMAVGYTCVEGKSDGTSATTRGTANVPILAVGCNNGSSRVVQSRIVSNTLSSSQPKITQQGGCQCSNCHTITPTSGECGSKPTFTATPN